MVGGSGHGHDDNYARRGGSVARGPPAQRPCACSLLAQPTREEVPIVGPTNRVVSQRARCRPVWPGLDAPAPVSHGPLSGSCYAPAARAEEVADSFPQHVVASGPPHSRPTPRTRTWKSASRSSSQLAHVRASISRERIEEILEIEKK